MTKEELKLEPGYTMCDVCLHDMICKAEQRGEPYREVDMCIMFEPQRPYGKCKTCKHFVKGGLDGKTYVCEHPNIDQDDYYNYAFLAMDENDFCSCYEKKEGEEE